MPETPHPLMSNSKKFMFEKSFDDSRNPLGADKSDAQQQKLDQLLAEAFAKGQKAGQDEAMQSIERQAADYLRNLGGALQKIAQQQTQFAQAATQKASAAALLSLQQIFPHAAQHLALPEIQAMLHQTLQAAVNLPRLNLRVAAALQPLLEPQLQSLAEQNGFAGKIAIIADTALGLADCRIDWGQGGIEYVPTETWHEILKTWQSSLPQAILQTLPTPPDTNPQGA